MTISSSLAAGVAGLSAQATELAATADNIANSATAGYKRTETSFHSMYISSGGTGYTAGGVTTSTVKLIDERGPLVATNNSTDLAVQGGGFIPVTTMASVDEGGQPPLMLKTTGSFRPDDQGYLVTPTGEVLMGWPADTNGDIPIQSRDTAAGLEPISIASIGAVSDPTTEINISLILPATETEAGSDGDPYVQQVQYFDNLGKSQTVDVTYTPTVPATGKSDEWTVTITDSASAGAVIGEYTVTFQDDPVDGGTIDTVVPGPGAVGTQGGYVAADGTFEVQTASGPLTIGIGEPGSNVGIVQLGDSFVPNAATRNGNPVSSVTSVEVDSNGLLYAYFENGSSQVIYQVPLVNVENPNGLTALDAENYQVSIDSGPMFLWDAGDGPTGQVVGYAMEGSTTDIAAELTSLITTQRAYSSNAKVIQTVDEMLQETTNIKR